MFFRRDATPVPTAAARLQKLRDAGFTVAPAGSGAVEVSRGDTGVALRETGGSLAFAGRAGIVVGGEIGSLVDGGYQKFFETPGGKKLPARADQLRAIHDFEADVKEALGLASLYNESLGTVSHTYLYDRVADRDRGAGKRVWDR
jgi:hypothetical protein